MTAFKKLRKALLALLVAVVFMITFLIPSQAALASEVKSDFAGGSGTEEDPYLINNAQQLDKVRNYSDSYFQLNRNIDLSFYLSKYGKGYNEGAGWQPIGTEDQPFEGCFFGGGYVIRGLYINRGNENNVGLFGCAGTNSELIGLRLEDVNVTGKNAVGAVAGKNEGYIYECYATGSVSGNEDVGGLAGYNVGWINDSFTDCNTAGSKGVGGLAGSNDSYIVDCYTMGAIDGSSCVGGVVGINGEKGGIYACYAVGAVSGGSDTGGIVGLNDGDKVLYCYYDSETTGQSDTGKGDPRDTKDMKLRSTFKEWSFTEIWAIDEEVSYPMFRWQDGAPLSGFYAFAPRGSAEPGVACRLIIAKAMDEDGTTLNGLKEVSVNNVVDGENLFKSEVEFTEGEATVTVVLNTIGSYVLRVDLEDASYSYLFSLEVLKPEFDGGTGTADDPYLIADVNHLNHVRYCLDAYFKLTEDIDMNFAPFNEGEGWRPIGDDDVQFSGYFDGNGKTIKGLYINRASEEDVGLFSSITEGSTIINLILEDVDVTGGYYVAGLVGWNEAGEIINCYVSGSVTGNSDIGGVTGENSGNIVESHSSCNVNGGYYAGGLVGWNWDGEITNSNATGVVTGNTCVGGLLGGNYGTVLQCYSTGTVTGENECAGGLVGDNYSDIVDSYATGEVTGKDYVGGLVGYNFGSVMRSYAIGDVDGSDYVGGLVGLNEEGRINFTFAIGSVNGSSNTGGLVGKNKKGSITKSYYDSKTTGRSQNDNKWGIPKVTAEMKQKATFEGWDFDTVWEIAETQTYPFLRWRE